MRCYLKHLREHIENLKKHFENLMLMSWELDENTLGTGGKKTFPLSPKTQKRKLIPPNKSFSLTA
jgi:hypothetical protein